MDAHPRYAITQVDAIQIVSNEKNGICKRQDVNVKMLQSTRQDRRLIVA